MNDGKEGGRYRYPESLVKLLAVVHAYVLISKMGSHEKKRAKKRKLLKRELLKNLHLGDIK